MDPQLDARQFVFCSVAPEGADLAALSPQGMFREKEGLTLILERRTAEAHGLAFEGAFAMITLHVHSSLQAVGLTAAFARRLAQRQISANVVAGYYHDHIFVAVADAEKAITAVRGLQQEAAGQGGAAA